MGSLPTLVPLIPWNVELKICVEDSEQTSDNAQPVKLSRPEYPQPWEIAISLRRHHGAKTAHDTRATTTTIHMLATTATSVTTVANATPGMSATTGEPSTAEAQDSRDSAPHRHDRPRGRGVIRTARKM